MVVTGLGAVSSNGHDREAYRHALRHGVSGVHRIVEFDTTTLRSRVAGTIQGLDLTRAMEAEAAPPGQPDGPLGRSRRARGGSRMPGCLPTSSI